MASPNISFDSIPSSIRIPGKYFEFNTKLAVRSLPGNLQRVLLVGQRLSTGTLPALTVVNVSSDALAAEQFGYGSIAHKMVRAAIKANPYAQFSVVAVDDDEAGVAASGTITLTGTATSVGDVSLTIAGERIAVSVTNGETSASIATRLATLINSSPDLPVAANSATSKITLTAKHKGLAGNSIKVSGLATAVEIGITVTAMSSGANDPDIGPALAAAFSANHQIVVAPFDTADTLTTLRQHVDAVGHSMEQRDAIGVAGTAGTLSSASMTAQALNSGLITFAWHHGSVRSAAEIAAAYAAVIASEEDPARPLNTLALNGLDVTPVELRIEGPEITNALYSGVTPLEIGPGDKVQIVRAIRSKYFLNLVAFIFTEKTVINEYTGELVADCLCEHNGCNRRVNSTGQCKEHFAVADFFADLLDGVFNESIHLPVSGTSTDTKYEVGQHGLAFYGVKYFRMILDRIQFLICILSNSHRTVCCMCSDLKSRCRFGNVVCMAHPYDCFIGYIFENPGICLINKKFCLTIFADICFFNFTAKDMHHKLSAVAKSKNRNTKFKQLLLISR